MNGSRKIQKGTGLPINRSDGQSLFRKMPLLPPAFSFGGLSFVETPRFPREIYQGQGVENIVLPPSDKEKNAKYFIITLSGGQAVGAILVNPAKKIATHLFILPEERGKGYGLSVIEAFEDYARKNNWLEIKTHVPADRPATLGILEKRGWVKLGPHASKSGRQFYIVKKSLF